MTIYLSGVSNAATCIAGSTYLYGRLGVLLGPGTFGGEDSKDDYTADIPNYCAWGLDNGCFSNHGAFNERAWLSRLQWIIENVDNAMDYCLFAVAPDVFNPNLMLGDQAATIERSLPVLAKIRELGVPAALVIQDGLLEYGIDRIPWDAFDVAFLGGSDDLKLGYPAKRKGLTYLYDRTRVRSIQWAAFIAKCHAEGKGIHMGRVNSALRLALAREIWADSADGTYLRFRGTTRGLKDIDTWTQIKCEEQHAYQKA